MTPAPFARVIVLEGAPDAVQLLLDRFLRSEPTSQQEIPHHEDVPEVPPDVPPGQLPPVDGPPWEEAPPVVLSKLREPVAGHPPEASSRLPRKSPKRGAPSNLICGACGCHTKSLAHKANCNPPPKPHVHHYVFDSPSGPTSTGRCSCGATQTVSTAWPRRVHPNGKPNPVATLHS